MTDMNARVDDVGPAQAPLGTVLTKRGLLTEEQLELALADQRSTGEPLGKIVVDRGFVRAEVIAQALATQHGGLLKTEYGFATGFGSGSPAAPPVAAPPVSESPRTARTAATAPAPELVPDPKRADQVERIASLEEAVQVRDEALAKAVATNEAWQTALAERDDLIRTLVAARDEATAELVELRAERDAALDALRVTQASLDDRERANEELVERVAAAEAQPAEPWATSDRHLLFYRGPEMYELLERAGQPPAVGSTVQVPGGQRVVSRVGASPVPGGDCPCAYLVD
jgi:hypothetical protein